MKMNHAQKTYLLEQIGKVNVPSMKCDAMPERVRLAKLTVKAWEDDQYQKIENRRSKIRELKEKAKLSVLFFEQSEGKMEQLLSIISTLQEKCSKI